MKKIMFVFTSVKFLTILILFGVCIDEKKKKKRLKSRPFMSFWHFGAKKHPLIMPDFRSGGLKK